MKGNVKLEFNAPFNMACKPIITYAGDAVLFRTLESSLVEGLPKEVVDWKRSYGRAVKSVSTKATFVPFSKDILPKGWNWQLTHQPIFHVFWTECVDVEVYKSTVRDEIESWLRTLNQHNIPDWLIVIVETYDLRKSNKLLPRTTVLDKIRSDFASKHADRCLSVINPVRSESRSAESWRGLLSRVCVLMLAAYNRTLIKFEEFIRDQRERRNELGWNFCHYFLLQEELAFVLEMLGVYDEALVQYDELDALFTQFVLNSNVGEVPAWLSSFQSPLDSWSGLVLDRSVDQTLRLLLGECRASLLQFRSYLFSRQCTMLQLLQRPHEMAQRCLPFLHNCVKELGILEIAAPPGAVACWVFLCCLEVLQSCQAAQEASLEACALFTAPLWAYARDKLQELGELCGLLPGLSPSSEQLHTVVLLSAGMGDSQGDRPCPSPTDILKEALSSAHAFTKHYLEMAELAMGTYKHIGRLRCARAVGRDLAHFYLRLGQSYKAAAFLLDSLQAFQDEGWARLVPSTQLELAWCCQDTGDKERFVKICAAIASSPLLANTARVAYFDEMMEALGNLPAEVGSVMTSLADAFSMESLEVCEELPITEGSTVTVQVSLGSLLPRPVLCSRVALSVEEHTPSSSGMPSARPHEPRRPVPVSPAPGSSPACARRFCAEDARPANPAQLCLHMVEHLDYKQDRSLSCASIVSRNPKQFLRRRDSQGRSRKTSTAPRVDFSYCLSAENILIQPGCNSFSLTCQAREKGWYRLGQLSLLVAEKLEFLSPVLSSRVGFEVCREPANVTLNKGDTDLLAGLEQQMVLSISTGTHVITQDSVLRLRASRGLQMQVRTEAGEGKSLCREVCVPLPHTGPFSTLSVELIMLADLPPKKDPSSIEHKVCIQCPWQVEEKVAALHFQPPFMSTLRLHTAQASKFVQVLVAGLNTQLLELEGACLAVTSEPHLHLRSLDPSSHHPLLVGDGTNASFMWEIDVSVVQDTAPIKTDFSVKYRPLSTGDTSQLSSQLPFTLYKCNFDITDYKTLFAVKCRVEPMKGSDFLRSGTMCSLLLDVHRLCPGGHSSLMYEVLADQAVWAICGRTAGVISLETVDKQHIVLDVMPLIGGYLPLPGVRLSKYIPAEIKTPGKDTSSSHPRLEPFSPGQVYNSSKAQQVHILPPADPAPS